MHPESSRRVAIDRLNEGAELRREFARLCGDELEDAAAMLEECFRKGRKTLIFGNGGSAADAQHLAAELVGRVGRERRPLPALALTTDTSALTAIGNDYGFDEIFARQVLGLTDAGDVVVGISTSGRSSNVTRAVRVARDAGATTIGLTGGDGGDLAGLVDIAIVVPSWDTSFIQEMHIAAVHFLCEAVEERLFPSSMPRANKAAGVTEWDTLLSLRSSWGIAGKTVVWTNGCFDVLHAGHVHCLEQARLFGDVLVVGVNSDDAVRRLKGPGRPVFPLEERMRILAGLKVVDYVVGFEGVTPEAPLADLKPDVHVKGEDYAPPSGSPIPERSIVESYGGTIKFVSLLPQHSSSSVISRMREGL